MNRYSKTFETLKSKNQMAFAPFWMCGDPDPAESLSIMKNQIMPNADILEVGIPFSDPLADGPTIQASVNRALDAGTNIDKSFEIIAALRDDNPSKPIGALVYFNLILGYGMEAFFAKASAAGLDSILIPEIPIESFEMVEPLFARYDIAPIFLVSTNTPSDRLDLILAKAKGFLYVISTPSITGAKTDVSPDTVQLIQNLKQKTDLPLVVGFGISTPEHLQCLRKAGADGAIIGSKLFEYREDSDQMEAFLGACMEICKK